MEKTLEGELGRFEVPDVLSLLHTGGRTGVLVLERSDQETKLFLRGGRPVFATSTKQELRFGSLLVRLGKLDEATLERILKGNALASHRLGQALLTERVLKQDELATALKIQVSEVIFDAFAWRDGTFTFYDKVPPPITAITLEMELSNLVMEGARRLNSRDRLGEIFPEPGAVPECVGNPERIKRTVTLTQEEWQVYFLVDGRRSLSEISRMAGGDEADVLQILHHFLMVRFIVLGPPQPAAPMPAPVLPASAEPSGTQKLEGGAPPGFSVEFSPPPMPRPPEDDTKEIVRPQAIPYLGKASKRLTLSRLVLMKDGGEASFPLTRDSYTLGRHRNNDIVINDPKVSSFHARIDRTPEGFVLVDLKSRNGSFINGKRIETGLLATGDEVRLGTARLVYKVDYSSAA
jgi:hypothetical protein